MPATNVQETLEPVSDSALALSQLTLSPDEYLVTGSVDNDVFVFGVEGASTCVLSSTGRGSLAPGDALFIPAGETAELQSGPAGLVALLLHVSPACDQHAPLGPITHFASVERSATADATGQRTYRVLFGPDTGSCRATLFVGYVPPGKAPWHFHQYDEIVWIWHGTGRFHAANVRELSAGSAFRIRPRQVHIVENLTEEELLLIGIFTPAGSPSAAYLPSQEQA